MYAVQSKLKTIETRNNQLKTQLMAASGRVELLKAANEQNIMARNLNTQIRC